jgi:hypothetical protein
MIPQEADIRARIAGVRQRIAAACERVGREPKEVTLMAVTKTISAAAIQAAYEAGICFFGENRVQEAAAKISPTLLRAPDNPAMTTQWHLIGHLQTNKAKKALELFQAIQSVDSLRLAEALQRQAEMAPKTIEIFIEVNTSGEAAKFGVPPGQALSLAHNISALPNLQLTGLMTIGALTEDQAAIRRGFRQLRELQREIAAAKFPGVNMQHLSMGMTDDFELAIEEGSTLVRVGRAIFGAR